MAAVPSIGRADRVAPREADLTRELYERYATQIFHYCRHQLGSREEAEDAVQSTFLNAFRGIKRGIVPEQESAWLFRIAHNVCLSRRRSTWRRGRIESPADFQLVEELTAAPTRLADELVGLQDVLERMPANQRRAILLREWQGLSYREIATELELSQTAVETLIFRARRSLAQGLEEPPQPARRRRLARGVDLGNVLAALKSLLLGGGVSAAKVAAVATVVGAGTVAVSTPAQHHHRNVRPPTPAAPAPAPAAHPVSTPSTVHVPAPARPAPAPPARPHHRAARTPPPPAAPPPAIAAVTPPPPAEAQPPAPAETPPPPAEPAPSVPAARPEHAHVQVDAAQSGPPARTSGEVRGDRQTDQAPPPQDPPPAGTSDAPSAPEPAPAPAQPAAQPQAPPTGDGGDANGKGGGNGNGHGQGDSHGHGR